LSRGGGDGCERCCQDGRPRGFEFVYFHYPDGKAAFQKHQGALEEAVKSLRSMNVDYPEKPK
jgi:hypothetical protein